MTRETKVGVALMILLVGVFGAIAYKKWNSRKPTSVAAAAVEPSQEDASSSTADDASGQSTDTTTVAVAGKGTGGPTPAGDDPLQPVPGNPFSVAENGPTPAPPMESDDPFATEGFVRSESAPVQPDNQPLEPIAESSLQASESDPPAQLDPATEAASPFAVAAENANRGDAPSVMDSPFDEPMPIAAETSPGAETVAGIESSPASMASAETAADDPFATPEQPAPPATPAAAEQPVVADDPFGTVAAATAETQPSADMTAPQPVADAPADENVDPLPSQGEPSTAIAAEEDPFAMPIAAAPDNSAAVAPEVSPSPATMAATSAGVADDPFAPTSEQTTETESTPATTTMIGSAEELLREPAIDTSNTMPPEQFPESVAELGARPVVESEPASTQDSPFASAPVRDMGDVPSSEAPAKDVAAGTPFAPPAAPNAQHDHYVVNENDSYWTISKRIYGTPIYFHALARYNAGRVPNPERLQPGMKILTPSSQELSARFPTLVSQGRSSELDRTAEAATPRFQIDDAGRPTYRVDKDDTLTDIAQAHLGRASRWVQIYEMNRTTVPDPKSLKPGTVLRLPADASRVRLVPQQ